MSGDAGRPMRVLLIAQFYPPVLGGVEFHVQTLARRLARMGHDVAVATQTVPGAPAFEDDEGVAVHRLSGSLQRIGPLFATERRHAAPVPDPEMTWRLRRLVRDFRPDVVHSHNWLGRSFVPLKRGSGAKYVVTLHDCSRWCAQGRMMYGGVEPCTDPLSASRCRACCSAYYGGLKGRLTFAGDRMMRGAEDSAADLYLPVSRAIAEANRLDEAGVRYEVVPNFAEDLANEAEPIADVGDLPDEPFVLQVGDVVHDKGVGVLLDAHARLAERPPLVLVGRVGADAPEQSADVRVLGPRSHAFVREAWRRSLFGTMPSLCLDASPTVTLEAMAAGKPVVASAVGGLLDQVDDGTTGLLVAPGDAAALSAAMARLISDPASRTAMGAAARASFERSFSAEAVVARIGSLYRSLIGSDA